MCAYAVTSSVKNLNIFKLLPRYTFKCYKCLGKTVLAKNAILLKVLMTYLTSTK